MDCKTSAQDARAPPATAPRAGGKFSARSCSGRIGSSRIRNPVAWKTAFATAGATPTSPVSPTRLPPTALGASSTSSSQIASTLEILAAVHSSQGRSNLKRTAKARKPHSARTGIAP